MQFMGTRGGYPQCSSSEAMSLGLVPNGGLFVPAYFPVIPPERYIGEMSYQQIARAVFEPLLTDFSGMELQQCLNGAYSQSTFDAPGVIEMVELDESKSIMELWHGPTAAFKDVALQIMPHFMAFSKRKTGNTKHTIILVATSGDTGKAALEGFKDAENISVVVFYPHDGVSDIQRLQMATTTGRNTTVIGVRGNFDDCQTGVKRLFSDAIVREKLGAGGFELSSANSINWGRLCPQIVYYFAAYADLVRRGKIASDDVVNIAVPTGNFGNILAGYYALRMGLPIGKLICASNKNRVLADFFATGVYDRNRLFFRTNSPSMDILISSNLERFLFELCGRDDRKINQWYGDLAATGTFTVDAPTLAAMKRFVDAGWVDEDRVLATIREVYTKTGYVLDTHTAVAVALCNCADTESVPTIIASTASPYKFSHDVLGAIEKDVPDDEFACIRRLSAISGKPVHRALAHLRELPVLHERVIAIDEMDRVADDVVAHVNKEAAGRVQ